MTRPTVRTLITAVQQALVETVDLALRRRWALRDLPALRAFASSNTDQISHRELAFVADQGRCWRYDATSNLPDDGSLVIAPADRTQKRGRWRRCELQDRYGRFPLPLHAVPPVFIEREPGAGLGRYAKQVQIYEGETEEEEELERLFGQRPSFLVQWESDSPQPRSNKPGCVYFGPQRFKILCIATNNRPDASALQGSPFDADQQQDGPGLNRMFGDLRYVLAGAQLGLGPYVERTEIGDAEILQRDLAQRLFVGALSVEVFASVHLADEYLLPLETVSVQPLLATGAGEDYVSEGFTVTPGAGLRRTPARGTALVGGQILTYEPQEIVLPASRDVYLDLQADGTLLHPAVAHGKAPPPLLGILRVGLIQTTANAVAGFRYLCPSLVPWRGPYEI